MEFGKEPAASWGRTRARQPEVRMKGEERVPTTKVAEEAVIRVGGSGSLMDDDRVSLEELIRLVSLQLETKQNDSETWTE